MPRTFEYIIGLCVVQKWIKNPSSVFQLHAVNAESIRPFLLKIRYFLSSASCNISFASSASVLPGDSAITFLAYSAQTTSAAAPS